LLSLLTQVDENNTTDKKTQQKTNNYKTPKQRNRHHKRTPINLGMYLHPNLLSPVHTSSTQNSNSYQTHRNSQTVSHHHKTGFTPPTAKANNKPSHAQNPKQKHSLSSKVEV
jgi:hypothetical protein